MKWVCNIGLAHPFPKVFSDPTMMLSGRMFTMNDRAFSIPAGRQPYTNKFGCSHKFQVTWVL